MAEASSQARPEPLGPTVSWLDTAPPPVTTGKRVPASRLQYDVLILRLI